MYKWSFIINHPASIVKDFTLENRGKQAGLEEVTITAGK
jgi:hypothetical protein